MSLTQRELQDFLKTYVINKYWHLPRKYVYVEVNSENKAEEYRVLINLIYPHTHTYIACGFNVLYDIFDMTVFLLAYLKIFTYHWVKCREGKVSEDSWHSTYTGRNPKGFRERNIGVDIEYKSHLYIHAQNIIHAYMCAHTHVHACIYIHMCVRERGGTIPRGPRIQRALRRPLFFSSLRNIIVKERSISIVSL